MLTKKQIIDLKIVQEATDKCWDQTSYNLRLGTEYIDVGLGDLEPRSCPALGLRIPAFGCMLVGTREWIRIPTAVYGRWGLKIRPALSGLIFQAGPQLEPGYEGRLFGLLFNLSSEERILDPKAPLWAVDFAFIPRRKKQELPPSSDATADLSISAYVKAETLPKGGPGQALTSLTATHERVLSAADKLENDVADLHKNFQQTLEREAMEKASTRENLLEQQVVQLMNKVKNRGTIVAAFFSGFVLIVVCAFAPLLITKITYDKDEFIGQGDTRNLIYENRAKLENLIRESERRNLDAITNALNTLTRSPTTTSPPPTKPQRESENPVKTPPSRLDAAPPRK